MDIPVGGQMLRYDPIFTKNKKRLRTTYYTFLPINMPKYNITLQQSPCSTEFQGFWVIL